MNRKALATVRSWWTVALCCVCMLPGCAPTSTLGGIGVEIGVPNGWKPEAPERWMVPGRALAAWSGPSTSSLVIYRTIPVADLDAAALAQATARRLDNLPGFRLISEGVITVSGRPAARVEVVAPGTGDALASNSTGTPVAREGVTLVPTRRVHLAIPRGSDTINLVFHVPEAEAGQAGPTESAILASLRVSEGGLVAASY